MVDLNPVLSSTKLLTEASRYVQIDQEALEVTAQKYSKEKLIIPDWSGPMFPQDPDVKAAFLIVGNAINFAYTNFETGEKWESAAGDGVPSLSGAHGMWGSLMKALNRSESILDYGYLRSLREEDMGRIFYVWD